MTRRLTISCLLFGALLSFPVISAAQQKKEKPPESSSDAIQRAKEEIAATEKLVAAAAQAREQASKILAEQTAKAKAAAAKAAKTKAAADQAAAAKADAARAAAAKVASQRTTQLNAVRAKVEAAQKAILAEQAWMARKDAAAAETALLAAEKTLAARTKTAALEQTRAAAAAKAAARAAAEQTAAEKASQAAPEEKKAAARKLLEQKKAAAQKAARTAKAAREAADKAGADRATAAQAVTEKNALLKKALDTACFAHTEAIGGLKPITSAQWDYARARHLLFRAGFGGTPEDIQRLVDMGPHRAVDFLVDYHDRPVANLELEVQPWIRQLAYEARLHPLARRELGIDRNRKQFAQRFSLNEWWLKRMAESPRSLEEKLVLFWHDHFASSWLEVLDIYLMYQQNQLFRRYADKYDALLHGIVQDPAMIRYLTNDRNTKKNNNENLGREVLELFSLGEENSANYKKNGYTEKDVRDGMTRALTGFSYDRPTGQFRFYSSRHDTEPKTLLGKTGHFGPHEALDIVLQHPATARYVSKKLYEYFAHFNPEPQVLERLAHVLRENSYELRPMLKNLFLSEQFYTPSAMGNHIKGPIELMISTAKLLKLSNLDYKQLNGVCSNMGQALLDPPNVAGWPEGRAWINANLILIRYNAVTNLVQRPTVDLVALLEGRTFNGSAEVVDHFIQRCLLTSLPEEKRQALIDLLGPLPPSSAWGQQREAINARLRVMVATLMSMPEYQVS